MPFVKPLPHWEAPGIEPPLWKAGVKPPSDYFNYLQSRSYEALKELQEYAVHKDDAGSGVTNLGFRGHLAHPVVGIGGPDHIDKYPEGLSAMYTDRSDWSVYFNMTDFVSAIEFLFIETNKTIQDGKINATQQITRYKKESTSTPVKLISQYKRVWYSDPSYTGWSNAEKVVFQTEFTTHLAEKASLTNAGHVQLSNALDSDDETKAPTSKALKLLAENVGDTILAEVDFSVNNAASLTVNGIFSDKYKKILIQFYNVGANVPADGSASAGFSPRQ